MTVYAEVSEVWTDLEFDIRAFAASDLWHISLPGASKPLCGRAGSEWMQGPGPLELYEGPHWLPNWCSQCRGTARRLDRQYGREDRP